MVGSSADSAMTRDHRKMKWFMGLALGLLMLVLALPAYAEEEAREFRIALTEIPGGGEARVQEALQEVPTFDVRSSEWFEQQVRGRAFRVPGVTERPSDMMWVIRGSSIDVVVVFVEDGEDEYLVKLLTARDGTSEYEFHVDRGDDGPTRGGARLVRIEIERFASGDVVTQTDDDVDLVDASLVGDETDAAGQEAQRERRDPEAIRQEAAREQAALEERLSRDWLWARVHFRLFQNDFSAAGTDSVYSYDSMFPGFELDIEAFPFVLGNTDLVQAGFYVTYNHGFDGITIADSRTEVEYGINDLTLEGGAIYRLDSPLDESNRQVRFKLGARYESFMVSSRRRTAATEEDALRNPIAVFQTRSLVAVVLGLRLVQPVFVEEFAITAGVDIAPIAFFGAGAELFGETSFSYGFGTELGMVYEMVDNFFLSAGYTFRLTRSDFEGISETAFIDSDLFNLHRGLRAGLVYQY